MVKFKIRNRHKKQTMKKTIISPLPEHIDARLKYGENLSFVSSGANITQVIEGINSSIIMLILFYSHVGKYGTISVVASSIVAIALSYTVQSVIRGAFSTYSRLKNDDKDDSFQRSEITFSLITGVVSALIALCLTFGSSYAMSKAVNATDRHSIVAVNTDYDARIENEKLFWAKTLEAERSDYGKTTSNIESKYSDKAKTAKTASETAYISSQKQKSLDKNRNKFDAKILDIEAQKNKDIQSVLDAKNTAVLAAQTENSANETTENNANNMAWWSFFAISVVLVSTTVVFVYKKAAYMEKCGIKVVNEREAATNYHTAVIVKTVFRRFFVNHIKKAFVNFNNRFGTDLDDIVGSGVKTATASRQKSNMDKIVFTAPAEIEQPKQVETPQTEQPKQVETNVVEFDLKKADVVVEQQNTQNKTDFELNCKSYLNGVTVNKNIESLMSDYSKGNALDLGARRSGITTALKRFYEYSARANKTSTPQEAQKLKKMIALQTENILANGLYILSNGGCIESGVHDNGLFFVTVKLKRK